MARRKLTPEVARSAEQKPRRRHASLSIDPEGMPRFKGRVHRPVVWFERSGYVSSGDGSEHWYSSDDFTVTAVVDGVMSLLLYFERRRLNSAVFALNLTPYQLGRAIEGVRRAGLDSLVLGALREMRRQIRGRSYDTPQLRAAVRRHLAEYQATQRRSGRSLEGALVRFERLPPWTRQLPSETRRVFDACVGGSYRVDEVTRDGHLVLDVSLDIDARFGGFRNDLRVERKYVRVVSIPASRPKRDAGGRKRNKTA